MLGAKGIRIDRSLTAAAAAVGWPPLDTLSVKRPARPMRARGVELREREGREIKREKEREREHAMLCASERERETERERRREREGACDAVCE
jgi:hypothetical protein